MTRIQAINSLFFLFLAGSLAGCGQAIKHNDYLVKVCDTASENCGYANPEGVIVIPPGKYSMCFTDTFRTFAIVTIPKRGFVAIDRKENILFDVFPFDNGPDYPSDGLFRIIANNKIGYADPFTGKIVIAPQFECAWPFENGLARVSIKCTTQSDGEHSTWLSDNWYYIDKKGKKAEKPKETNE